MIIFLLAGLLYFRAFLFENFVLPLALTIWIFLRISILAIDQKVLWLFMLFFLALYFFFKAQELTQDEGKIQKAIDPYYRGRLRFWDNYFREPNERNWKKGPYNELVKLLTDQYAANNRLSSDYRLYTALLKREIPIPDSIYHFLFHDHIRGREKLTGRFRKFIRKITGKEKKLFLRNLEQYLDYIELTT